MTDRPPASDDAPTPEGLVVDARGLRCPLPIIRLAARARGEPSGTVLVLLSDDPAAELDVAAWCRMRGHVLRDQRREAAGHLVSVVLTGSPRPAS